MAGVPKHRQPRSRTRKRRSHLNRIARNSVISNKCSNCGSICQSHRVCKNCGYYKGKLIKKAI